MSPRAYVIGASTYMTGLRYHPVPVIAKKLWIVPTRVDDGDIRERVVEGGLDLRDLWMLQHKHSEFTLGR